MLSYFLISNAMAQTARDSTASAQRVAESAVLPLEARLDQLELACSGMWELLRDKFQLTDAELLAKVEEIDLRDGQRNHKINRGGETCPTCQRRIATKSRVRCIYCGNALPQVGLGS